MGKQNLYPGINPHLNSHLQHVEGWEGFHNLFLGDMLRVLEPLLTADYYCLHEASLQIGMYLEDIQLHKDTSKTDLTIYRAGDTGERSPALVPGVSTPTLIFPALEEADEDEFISSVVIYKGPKPVTRIELISPANKPPGSHAEKYLFKREQALKSGLNLVEIDFIHSRRSLLPRRIPSYPDRQPNAYPYAILVTSPRPSLAQSNTIVYGFGVLDPLPVIDIPLDGDEKVRLDFGQVYSLTFSTSRAHHSIFTDYTREPVNFDAYSDADKALIRQQMAKIAGSQSQ